VTCSIFTGNPEAGETSKIRSGNPPKTSEGKERGDVVKRKTG